FDLGLFQRFVIGCLLRCRRCVLLCVGESLLSYGQLGLQARQLGLLLVVACFQLFQFAQLGTKHGGFDLGLFQRFVIGCLLRCGRCVLLCVGESLLSLGQLGLQTRQLGLLLVVACFQLLQLA